MQIKTVFHNAVKRLKQAGITESELEASLLLAHVLEMKRTAVLLAGEKVLNDTQLEVYERNVSRRLAREPLAYIIGEKEFWSLPFKVTKDVLIPRPETEFLLEKTLDVLKSSSGNPAQIIKRTDLGHLTVGAEADLAVLDLLEGEFGYIDVQGYRMDGTKKLECELTVKGGQVMWDLNGISRPHWTEK